MWVQDIRRRHKASTPGPWDAIEVLATPANIDFMQHAHADVEALLDEVEVLGLAVRDLEDERDALEEQRDALEKGLEEANNEINGLLSRQRKLEATVEQLEGDLRRAEATR